MFATLVISDPRLASLLCVHNIANQLLSCFTSFELSTLYLVSNSIHAAIERHYSWRLADGTPCNFLSEQVVSNTNLFCDMTIQFDLIKEIRIEKSLNCDAQTISRPKIAVCSTDYSVMYINESLGWGLYSNRTIAKFELLIAYCGELVRTSAVATRLKSSQQNNKQAGMNYVLTMREHVTKQSRTSASSNSAGAQGLDVDILSTSIDASRMGNIARFVNHSCDPNAEIIMLRDSPTSILGIPVLRAVKTIAPTEQITFDYGACEDSTLLANVSKADAFSSGTNLLGTNHKRACTDLRSGDYDVTSHKKKAKLAEVMEANPICRSVCYCGARCCSGFLPYFDSDCNAL